jgi:hypothetical protein
MNPPPSVAVLLAEASAWVEALARDALARGRALAPAEVQLAHRVGVRAPERVRVLEIDDFPLPTHPAVLAAACEHGLLSDATLGLTAGHAVLIRRGHVCTRLLLHEFRHVHQYEAAGSIRAFLTEYLAQLMKHGYRDAPLEIDARAHELLADNASGSASRS